MDANAIKCSAPYNSQNSNSQMQTYAPGSNFIANIPPIPYYQLGSNYMANPPPTSYQFFLYPPPLFNNTPTELTQKKKKNDDVKEKNTDNEERKKDLTGKEMGNIELNEEKKLSCDNMTYVYKNELTERQTLYSKLQKSI